MPHFQTCPGYNAGLPRPACVPGQILEFLNPTLGLVFRGVLSLIKDVQIQADRVSTGGGPSRREAVRITSTRAVCVMSPRHSRESHLARFPAERMRENTTR